MGAPGCGVEGTNGSLPMRQLTSPLAVADPASRQGVWLGKMAFQGVVLQACIEYYSQAGLPDSHR
jgi:hypothetical protein